MKLVEKSGMSVELQLPNLKYWRVHNVFHISLLKPNCASAKGILPPPIAVTDRDYFDRFGIEHEVGYDMDEQLVLEDF